MCLLASRKNPGNASGIFFVSLHKVVVCQIKMSLFAGKVRLAFGLLPRFEKTSEKMSRKQGKSRRRFSIFVEKY